MMYVPRGTPYLPRGTLREVLAYPLKTDRFDGARLRAGARAARPRAATSRSSTRPSAGIAS